MMDKDTKYVLEQCVTDFRFFARNCIKIKGKKPGSVLPFEFNVAQEILWETRVWMLAQYGWVRLIIVKGRQQGCSTFIEILFLWIILFTAYIKVCIISHELASSVALAEKPSFAIQNLDGPLAQGRLPVDNTKKIELPNGSEYMILTAGSEEAGRSQTAHLQHQSERAFYKDHEAIDAGAGQIVALEAGTEVYKESTANGMNAFYHEVKAALKFRGFYRVIFIPWYVEPAYRAKPEPGFERTQEEQELLDNPTFHTYVNPYTQSRYAGLRDDWQLQWRRYQIVELKSLRKFKQEYPNFLGEAFQLPGNCLFNLDKVDRARFNNLKENPNEPLILGCDPARTGDRTVIVLRRGRKFTKKWIFDDGDMDSIRLFQIISKIIDEYGVDAAFIDWAKGEGTIDLLLAKNYRMVQGVHFGGHSSNPLYANKRAEMYFDMRDWFDWEKNGESDIFDDEDVYADLQSIPDWKTIGTKMGLVPKEKIKEELGQSPDIADSMSLTFAYPVASKHISIQDEYIRSRQQNTSEISTLNDFRNQEVDDRRGSAIIDWTFRR